jgi:antitoxin YefM
MYIKRNMLSATMSDFRREMKKYLDLVTMDFETLIINRGKDSGVVVISLDEYNSLQATMHELSSKANVKRLDEAVRKLERGEGFEKELIDP